jgi:hypothetical protein
MFKAIQVLNLKDRNPGRCRHRVPVIANADIIPRQYCKRLKRAYDAGLAKGIDGMQTRWNISNNNASISAPPRAAMP